MEHAVEVKEKIMDKILLLFADAITVEIQLSSTAKTPFLRLLISLIL